MSTRAAEADPAGTRLAEYRALAAAKRAVDYHAFFAPVTGALARRLGPVLAGVSSPVIDAGCGSDPDEWATIGFDVDLAMLAVAREHAGPSIAGRHRAALCAADASAMPLADAVAGAVVWRFLAPHVPDAVRAVAEVRRVLRPGGRFASITWLPSDRSPYTGLVALAAERLTDAPAIARELRRFDHRADDLQRAAAADGLVSTVDDEVAEVGTVASAEAWWRGLARASVGLSVVLAALPAPEQRRLRAEFLAAAAGYANATGECVVPVRARLQVWTRP